MDYWEKPEHNLVLCVGSARIRYLFPYAHDREMQTTWILPWAMADKPYTQQVSLAADYTICVGGASPGDIDYLENLGGVKFCLHTEPAELCRESPSVARFTNNAPELPNTWWAPPLLFWSPPTSNPKSRKCSAIESGKYSWRNQLLKRMNKMVGGLDGYGKFFRRKLFGAHGRDDTDNQKYLGLRDYAFSIGIENNQILDYFTEKFADVILNEAVPVYQGVLNWPDYFLPECFVLLADADKIDWNHWPKEYARRRPAVLAQREILRKRLNIFRYFTAIAEKPDLLSRRRPITIHTPI